MKKTHVVRIVVLLALLSLPLVSSPPAGAAAERVTVTLLATTDMHGFIYPHDYFTGKAAPRGLAAAATLIAQVRRETPNTLLIDAGDTIQGSTLEGVHQTAVRAGTSTAPDPMMLAMNAVGYDAMVVGNHEFNYGLKNLTAARQFATFPWLSANTQTGQGLAPFAPYILKTVAGVKVAVIGVTTAAIPEWEKPEQIAGFSWTAPEDGVQRALALLEVEQPDLVVVAVHGGLDRDAQTGAPRPGEKAGDNRVWQIAERFPQVAAIVYGHTHQRQDGLRVGHALLVQPRNWAMEVARLDFTLSREANGKWSLTERTSRLLPVTPETVPDPQVLTLARPYHDAAERYLEQPVAESATELSGRRGRFEDTALVDAIHEVQLHYAQAEVSFSALFNPQVQVAKGPVTVRQFAALYVYDNELYAVEGTGRMVREALENSARYFRTCPEVTCSVGPLIDQHVVGYNYDMAQGVDYEIDLTKPAGQRVRNLRYKGARLRDDRALRIAINNYRSAGSGGYVMFRDAPVVWRSGRDIRDLMVEYYTERRRLPDTSDGNWRLVPPRAVETLVSESGTIK
jgi:2',3'-cyclic-nucleotide 2'-phosphodiesterase/3'-nucleotidase